MYAINIHVSPNIFQYESYCFFKTHCVCKQICIMKIVYHFYFLYKSGSDNWLCIKVV